jgi:ABC-type amino acid transport substrate-binding protein
MKRRIAAAIALIVFAAAVGAQVSKLPDLKGRTIIAVTENAFLPLNFADPKTGKGISWEYDAVNEIGKGFIGDDAYGFIFKKGSDLAKPFNGAIASMKAEGTLDKLTMKWFVEYKP